MKRPRALELYASLWSLRGYPRRGREWSWQRKFAAIADAGFDGVYAPPARELAGRRTLRYRAVASFRRRDEIGAVFAAAVALGAESIDIQLGTAEMPQTAALALLREVRRQAERHQLPFAVETHRATVTETREKTVALARRYRQDVSEALPLCLDHSHHALVGHLAPPFWPALNRPAWLLGAAGRFHLRPFNGHHAQLPARTAGGRRTPEYRDWLGYVRDLFAALARQRRSEAVVAVIEVGHDRPAYWLSGFPDTWREVCTVARDVKRLWPARTV